MIFKLKTVALAVKDLFSSSCMKNSDANCSFTKLVKKFLHLFEKPGATRPIRTGKKHAEKMAIFPGKMRTKVENHEETDNCHTASKIISEIFSPKTAIFFSPKLQNKCGNSENMRLLLYIGFQFVSGNYTKKNWEARARGSLLRYEIVPLCSERRSLHKKLELVRSSSTCVFII